MTHLFTCALFVVLALAALFLLARLDVRGGRSPRWCQGCGYAVDPKGGGICTRCGVFYLRARPRWQRLLRLPHTVWRLYRLRVAGLRACARLAWAGAISKGDRA